jgi:alkylation response protein AidB-like acyl-CoA dehydrogenase
MGSSIAVTVGADRAAREAAARDPFATAAKPTAVDAFGSALEAVIAGWGDGFGAACERAGRVPSSVFQSLGDADVFRLRWSPGAARGTPRAVRIAQELSLVSAGIGLAVSLHNEVFLGLVQRSDVHPDRAELAEGALAGTVIGCFASTEIGGGSDVGALTTRARPEGDGWRIVGEKRFTSNAGTATHALVVAQAPIAESRDVPAVFVVDLSAAGVERRAYYETVGLRSCDTAELGLDTWVPSSALIGSVGSSFLLLKQALQRERIVAAAQAVAAARAALNFTGAACRQRSTGGVPLLEVGAVRQRLGAAAASLLAAQSAVDAVVEVVASGRAASRQIAALKLFTARAAGAIVDDCMQILGGRGYLDAFPLERYWRDIRVARIGGGTDEVMADIVAGLFERPSPAPDAWFAAVEAGSWGRRPLDAGEAT